jgi:WD40 repeat protein
VWSNGRLLTDAGDSTVIGWQTSTTSPLLTTGHSTVSNVVTMGRFGDIVVGILGNDGLYTRDLRTGRRTRLSVPIAAEDFVTWPDLGADGRTLAVSVIGGTGQDQRVIGYDVWDLGSATRLASIPTSGTGPAVVLPDERGLLTATDNGTYEVLSLPGGAVRRSFRVPFAGPRSDRLDIQPMAVTPAGDVLVEGVDPGPSRTTTVGNTGDQAISAEEQSPTDDRLGLIDPESGRLLGQASLGAIYDISTVGWSHDWSTLAVGTIDGTVETFDAHTLAVLHRPVVVTGGYVQSVDFSPDRRMLVVGGADGALSFWSTDTLTRLGPPITSVGNPSASWWAWFTAAGEVTGLMPAEATVDGQQPNDSQDFAFPGRPEEWLGQACRLAGGPMTSTQWASEIPDRPYPQLC